MSEFRTIDLNCDVGEGFENDAELLSLVSSANIACGFHAGDEATMTKTVELCASLGVAIGAHPGYPDRENFGRRDIDMERDRLADVVVEQVRALARIAAENGARLAHIKPHGAMYNRSARDPNVAAAIAEAVRDFDRSLILFGLSGSHSITEAERIGLRTAAEVFADRRYLPDGTLMPRSNPSAVLESSDLAAEQALDLVKYCRVKTSAGVMISIAADTICIHGDTPHAAAAARTIRERLDIADVRVANFDERKSE